MTVGSCLPSMFRGIAGAVARLRDRGGTPAEGRSRAAERFGVSEREARAIEEEGLAAVWPPLDEG